MQLQLWLKTGEVVKYIKIHAYVREKRIRESDNSEHFPKGQEC